MPAIESTHAVACHNIMSRRTHALLEAVEAERVLDQVGMQVADSHVAEVLVGADHLGVS